MKNRDRYILKNNEYDMLCRIQRNIMYGLCNCVIDAITGKHYPCENDKICMPETCEACILEWLNAE